MSGHTYTQDNYSNPRCAHARRGLMKTSLHVLGELNGTKTEFY